MTEKIWVYKLMGTLILLMASVIYGSKKIAEERRRLREAEALADLVEHISGQIEYTMKPLPEILGAYQSEILASGAFTEVACTYGLGKAWDAYGFGIGLPDGDFKRIFRDFTREIGRGYRKEELELCSLTLKQLRTEIDKYKEDSLGREKLYRTLPPMMVLSVVLIVM